MWSHSITVSTTGFHPVNPSSTLGEITNRGFARLKAVLIPAATTINKKKPQRGLFLCYTY